MLILKDFMNQCTPDTVLEELPKEQHARYLDYAEDLLDTVRENDVLHPKAACQACMITDVSNDTIWADTISLKNTILPPYAKVGTPIYPLIVTCGTELDTFLKESDDDLLQYFGNMLMQRCLEEGILKIAERIGLENQQQNITRNHFSLVIPGINGKCEADQLSQVLKMIPEGPTNTGITIKANGMILPLYSLVCVLYADDSASNLPEACLNFHGEQPNLSGTNAGRKFIRTLSEISGHM